MSPCHMSCACGAPNSSDTCDGASGRPATLASRAMRLIRRGWRAYWDWRLRRVTIMLLTSLDPQTLRDIGIHPSEIESLVRNGGDRRRCYSAAWSFRQER